MVSKLINWCITTLIHFKYIALKRINKEKVIFRANFLILPKNNFPNTDTSPQKSPSNTT